MSEKKSNRIPADQLTAYERWELPAMQATGNDALRSRVSTADVAVKPLTADDLEKIRQEAYAAGFEEGKEEGIKAGHDEGHERGIQEGLASGRQQGLEEGKVTGQQLKQTEIDESLRRLNSVMEQLLDPIRLHNEEIEEALLNLILAVTRAVIKRELSIDSRQIREVLSDALALLPPAAANVKISVNGNDFESVLTVVESMASGAQVIKLDEILPGGCKVETLHSLIDATVEKRFQKTVQQMLDRHTSSLPPEESPDLAESMGEMTDFHRDLLESEPEIEPVSTPSPAPDSASVPEVPEADQPALDNTHPPPEETTG